MTKILRSTTIIPQSLYVHRDADRQLRRVLEEMGRPGYVLVARQMGKTNLLLTARNELQTPDDSFSYIDLSNPFSSVRDYFRNITDTAIDVEGPRFRKAGQEIEKIRARDLPPHKEHELELRTLLKQISGKLVIILDEIDALTTSNFSDQIFGQIRSTYFSRANIPDYGRLTYVLSGVAEPSDLIKNTKLSPFNIGEKIYLDDFSWDEFKEFIEKSQIAIASDTVSAIYDWTGGNPRLTWDVCSELEDILLFGQSVTRETVDSVVKKIYLTTYDRAPIDHIRTLATASAEIRNALVEIRYGKGGAVADSTRSKLYLAGIIGSNRESIKIKNRILEQSLSEQWLRDVARERLSLLQIAADQIGRKQHAEAIGTLEECLQEHDTSITDRKAALDLLSLAQFELGRYADSIKALERGLTDKARFPAQYFAQIYRLAVCHFRLNHNGESIAYFREVAESCHEPKLEITAKVNLATALLRGRSEEGRMEALLLYRESIGKTEADTEWLSKRERERLLVTARYYLSQTLEQAGDIEGATQELESAIEIAPPTQKIAIMHALSRLVLDPARKARLVETCINVIIEERLFLLKAPEEIELGSADSTLGALLASSFELDRNLFHRLLRYCMETDVAKGSVSFETAYELLLALAAEKGNSALDAIGSAASDTALNASAEDSAHFFQKTIAYYAIRGENADSQVVRYLHSLKKKPRALDRTDLAILNHVIASRPGIKPWDPKDVLADLSIHRSLTAPGTYVLLDYYSMVIAGTSDERDSEQYFARRIVEVLHKTSGLPVGKADLKVIGNAAELALSSVSKAVTIVRTGKKPGRNDRVRVKYSDGSIKRAKYKHVEGELSSGNCILIGDSD